MDTHDKYGITLLKKACINEPDGIDIFRGYVTGHGNVIPGPGDPDGNELGSICPDELNFFTTEAGGEPDSCGL